MQARRRADDDDDRDRLLEDLEVISDLAVEEEAGVLVGLVDAALLFRGGRNDLLSLLLPLLRLLLLLLLLRYAASRDGRA